MKLASLRPLYDGCGGYVSVYLDTDRAREDAQHAIELRWRAAREQLAAEGADPATLDAVRDAVSDPEHAAPGTAAFARHGQIRLRAGLRDAPARPISRLAALPHVLPMLAQLPPRAPHLRVTATRAGGEVLAVAGSGEVFDEKATARDWPVHKTPTGGWSQDRRQRSAEQSWDANARELASVTTAAAQDIHAEHILIAGDVRARGLLLEHLDPQLRQEAVVIEDEVPPDSEAAAEAVARIIAVRAERACRDRFGHWQEQLARAGAVEGLADTVAALSDGRAADVFVTAQFSDSQEGGAAVAWIGPGGTELAGAAARLAERGVSEPASDRADAAITRAIACTDADLFFLPADVPAPREGIAATLRY